MGNVSNSTRSDGNSSSPIAMEAGLFEMFAPSLNQPAQIADRYADQPSLWRADAVHRANNLAQLYASLAHLAAHPSRNWSTSETISQMNALSHAYQALGRDVPSPAPCAGILTEIATRLIHIFGQGKQITGDVRAQEVSLPPDQRRALVLICSELIINALKYGYPSGRGGQISVQLCQISEFIELLVEDDGVGTTDDCNTGQGQGLIDRMAGILDAVVMRSAGGNAIGFRVSIVMPIRA